MALPLLRPLARHTLHASPPKRVNHTNAHHKEARFRPSIFIAVAILGSATYILAPSSITPTLNNTTFTQYTITARDDISPTSVLFTIKPRHHDPSPSYLLPRSRSWKHTLWSVEFKQPEVQIARHYTPLPPQDDEDPRDGKLRFYVRAVDDGEMSNYLNRLRVGNEVYLRGPHAGFDVLGRLGTCRNVVFLAGGTGVVPGMQVARAALDRDGVSRVKLLWAVRKREEVQKTGALPRSPWWEFWSTAQTAQTAPREITTDLANPSAMARELMCLKAKYGERLLIRLSVDEERTQFSGDDIRDVLAGRPGEQSPTVSGTGCQLHDQLLHVRASEFEDPGITCRCQPGGHPGKNLLIVSGPDGFIAHYAGDKMWLGGTLTQGPVGGIAGQLQRKNPTLASDWLILKL